MVYMQWLMMTSEYSEYITMVIATLVHSGQVNNGYIITNSTVQYNGKYNGQFDGQYNVQYWLLMVNTKCLTMAYLFMYHGQKVWKEQFMATGGFINGY